MGARNEEFSLFWWHGWESVLNERSTLILGQSLRVHQDLR
jgi:hypothetical protein